MTNGERKEAIKWVESRAKVATMPGAQKMFRFALEALRKWIGANRKGRITMTQNELDKILENHKKWLNGEDGGSRANLQGANLRGANLQVADLRGADLRDVNLWDAALQGAKLWGGERALVWRLSPLSGYCRCFSGRAAMMTPKNVSPTPRV